MRRTKFDYRSYHGRKTATDWLKWIALILAILAALAVAALLWGQKYFNYTDEGLKLTLPFFQQESPKPADPGQVDVVIEEEPEPKEDASQPVEPPKPEEATAAAAVPLSALLDGSAAALAEQAADAAEAELRQWAAEQDKYLTGRFSPGYGDWPIGVQPLVAAALDTARRAGLCVTENDLMTPRKSVTALLGLSDHPVKGRLAGCGHCVLNTRCEYRKRGKTCASE